MKRTKKGHANKAKTNKAKTNKAKTKKAKTNKANTKKANKGGMFRQSASKAAKEVFGKVFGETWPERIDRLNQMKDAVLKGTANAAKKGAKNLSSSSPKSFSSPSSNMRFVGKPNDHKHKHNDDENPNYKTPTKSTSTREPILLSNRLKNDETVEQRARRLGLSVAPTLQHPIPIVAKLFDDDVYDDVYDEGSHY